MTWLIIALGITITLGGCYCCVSGCTHCTDGSDEATIQLDLSGGAADRDTDGCCLTLNKSYSLAITGDPCVFTGMYENGDCATLDCDSCSGSGCTTECSESVTTPCDPSTGGAGQCSHDGLVTYDTDCDECQITERATISLGEGAHAGLCGCLCVDSGLIWDVDVFLATHPEVFWAMPGDPVYYCACTPPDCTTTVGKSGANFTATLGLSGSDATITFTGNYLSRTITGTHVFSGDPISCVTEMNALALTVGATGSMSDIEMSDCVSDSFPPPTNCLCEIPTNAEVTYIP